MGGRSCLQQPVQGESITFMSTVVFLHESKGDGEIGTGNGGLMSIFLYPPQGSACGDQGERLAWVIQLPPTTWPGNNCIFLLPEAVNPEDRDRRWLQRWPGVPLS